MKNKKLSKVEQAIYDDYLKCAKNAKEWIRKCILRLPKIEELGIWEKKGFYSIYDFAARTAGLNHNQTREALRVMKHIEDKPELMKIVEKRGINAVKPVAAIATKESASMWAEKAGTMSVHTLEMYVKDYRNDNLDGNNIKNESQKSLHVETFGGENGSPKPNLSQKSENIFGEIGVRKTTVSITLSPETLSQLEKVKGKEDWETLLKEFVKYKEEQERKFQEELEAEKPEPVQTNSEHVPNKIERFVKKRSKNKCEHKNCNKNGEHMHHTYPFALHKVHDPDKIRHLCKEHHSLAHYGLIEGESSTPQNWKTRKYADPTNFRTEINIKATAYKRVPA